MGYSRERLAELGRRREELRTELRAVGEEIERIVRQAYADGVGRGDQAEMARLTRMTRVTIGRLILPPDERWRRR